MKTDNMKTVVVDARTRLTILVPADASDEECEARKARYLAKLAESRASQPARSYMTFRGRRKAIRHPEWKADPEATARGRAAEAEAKKRREAEAKAKREADEAASRERQRKRSRERDRQRRAEAKEKKAKERQSYAERIAAIKPDYKPKRSIDYKAWLTWIKVNEPERYAQICERNKRCQKKYNDANREKILERARRRYSMRTDEQKRRKSELRKRWMETVKADPVRYAEFLERQRQRQRRCSERKKAERERQATEQ